MDRTYTSATAVTTSDTVVLPITSALYIGVSGDVAVQMGTGASVIFKAMPVGLYSLAVTQVLSTGTTATNILALR
jgi:hypothetical protein